MPRFARRPFRASRRRRYYARSKAPSRSRYGRSFNTRPYSRLVAPMVKGLTGTQTLPVNTGFGGHGGGAYATGFYRTAARVLYVGGYSAIDLIQFTTWSALRFFTMCSNSESLRLLALSHDQYRLVYSGIKIRPMFNITGPSTAIQTGDIFVFPVHSDNNYRFAAQSTLSVAPSIKPAYLTNISEVLGGSRAPTRGTIPQKGTSCFQKGFTFQDSFDQPMWNGQNNFDNVARHTTLRASDWESCMSTTQSTQSYSSTQWWAPCAVWANWNSNAGAPMPFFIEVIYKFEFKGRRMNTDTLGSEIELVPGPGIQVTGTEDVTVDVSGFPLEEEKKMEALSLSESQEVQIDEDEEKEPILPLSQKRSLPPSMLPPPPKLSKKALIA